MIDAIHANVRTSDDGAVFARAWNMKRLLITHDQDFLDDRVFPYATCPGLLVIPSFGRMSLKFANLLAGSCHLLSRGAKLWFHTKITVGRDFTLRVRTWERTEGRIVAWEHALPPGYRKAAADT